MERRSILKLVLAGLPLVIAQRLKVGKPPEPAEIEIKIPKELRQKVWEIAREPGRLSQLYPEWQSWEEDGRFAYAHAIYLENGDSLTAIDCICSTGELLMPRIAFGELITNLAPKTWNDLTFGLTLYQFCINNWATQGNHAEEESFLSDPLRYWPRFKLNKAVDALLADSRGALLWAEQFHNLYLLCDPDRENAIRFRKALHAGRPEALQRLQYLQLANGTALKDVLDERMVFGHTRHPNYRANACLEEHFVR